MSGVTDPAVLIVAFFEAWSDRHSETRDDPVLGPIITRALERYREGERGSDFTTAARLAATEAVREILEASGCGLSAAVVHAACRWYIADIHVHPVLSREQAVKVGVCDLMEAVQNYRNAVVGAQRAQEHSGP